MSSRSNLKLVFIVAFLVLAIIANGACFALLTNDNYSLITVNDRGVDSTIYNGDVAIAVGDALGVVVQEDGCVEYSGTSSSSSSSMPSDMTIVIYCLVGLNVMLVVTGILLYFVVANKMEGDRTAMAAFGGVLAAFLAICVVVSISVFVYITRKPAEPEIRVHAPIIYLYDEQSREANVKLRLNGELTCTYPSYDAETGWVVKTSPEGILTDANGRQYEYLFWEADMEFEPDLSQGFCVAGADSAAFLENALSSLGLSDTEANAFIMYWLPKLEENPYNVITFQTSAFEEAADLEVSPMPDTVVRVNMLFYASEEVVEIEPQDLSSMNPGLNEREGFVLVEWGGEELK